MRKIAKGLLIALAICFLSTTAFGRNLSLRVPLSTDIEDEKLPLAEERASDSETYRRAEDVLLALLPKRVRLEIVKIKLKELCEDRLEPDKNTPWSGDEYSVMEAGEKYGLWAHGTYTYTKYESRDLKPKSVFGPFSDLLFVMLEGETKNNTFFGEMKCSRDLFISCYPFGPFYIALNREISNRLKVIFEVSDKSKARMHDDEDPHRCGPIDTSEHLFYLVRNERDKELAHEALRLFVLWKLISDQDYSDRMSKVKTYKEFLSISEESDFLSLVGTDGEIGYIELDLSIRREFDRNL